MSNNMSNNKIYCLAPWIHTHINAAGERVLCCMANNWENSQVGEALEDHWNSERMKEARLNMLNGTPDPKICEACTGPLMTSLPQRNIFEATSEEIKKIISETSEDGTYSGAPTYYDYRLSNACNLSCRMCNEQLSSKIENAFTKITDYPDQIEALKQKKEKNIELLRPELLEAIKSGKMETIYWASGEAFIQKDHWDILNYCIQENQAHKITLRYNTNLSFPKSYFEKHEELFKHFKKVGLAISIDGVGENAEFIRDGLNWKLFNQNIDFCKSSQVNYILNFSVTLTIPTMLEFKPFLKFLYMQQLPFTVSVCHYSGTSSLYSPLALDNESLNGLIDKCLTEISTYSNPEFFIPFRDVFESLRNKGRDVNQEDFFIDALNDSQKMDRQLGRPILWEYYLKFPIIRKWAEKRISPIKEIDQTPYYFSEEFKFEDDIDPYAKKVHLKYSNSKNGYYLSHHYHLLPDPDKFFKRFEPKDYIFHRKIGIIGSAPTLLNNLLSKDTHEKYKMFNEIIRNKEDFEQKYPYLKVTKVHYLPLFEYLLNKKSLSFLAPALDLMSFPIRRFIAFHAYALIEVQV